MVLLCVTASHQNASFDLLDTLSVAAPGATKALVRGSDLLSGAVVLSTCNRFEAYLDVPDPAVTSDAAAGAVFDVLSAASGVSIDTLRGSLCVLDSGEVVEHLFAVSSGLESVIVGEDEISGQVRRALEKARRDGTTTSSLERLFQTASRTARDVKRGTALGGAGRSLVRLALELASSRIADWSKTRVLIVGTGQYAATTVAALRHYGAADLRAYSSSGRGMKFALRHELRMQADLAAGIRDADVVITCTATAAPVITRQTLAAAQDPAPGRNVPAPDAPGRPHGCTHLIIDLGLPRNVDPAVGTMRGIELLDLETISLHAPVEELNASSAARDMVGAAAAEFEASAAEQTLTSGIVALRAHVFGLLDAEIQRARSRGDSTEHTEAALHHLVGVLLHTPSVRARALARQGDRQAFVDGLEALFGIQLPAAEAADSVAAWPADDTAEGATA